MTSAAMDVRYAMEEDLDWLLGELKEFAEFMDTKYSLFADSESLRRTLLTNMVKEHLFLVAQNGDGERVGFVAGLIHEHIFNPAILVCQETFWWVVKKHRGGRAALKLLDAYVEECEALDVQWIFFSMQFNTPASDRVLLKRGFELREKFYLKEV